MKLSNDIKFFIIILPVSLIIRLVLAVLYNDPPDIPHDFYAYMGAGKTILEHGILYIDTYGAGVSLTASKYGPLFALTMASFIGLFGEDYLAIKFASIFFDLLSIIALFYLVKNLKSSNAAKFVCITYALSYVTIWSSGAEGFNNSMFIFFMLLSLYFLTKNNPNFLLSPIFLGISLGYKLTPIALIPPILFYIYKTGSIKVLFGYLLKTSITLAIILFPFYLMAGTNVFYPYNIGASMPVDGMSILNFIKMLSYYFIFGSDKPYDTYIFPEWIGMPFSIMGISLALIYIIKYQIKDRKLELIRNSFIFIFSVLMFSKTFYGPYILWLLPFVLIIAAYNVDFSRHSYSLLTFEKAGFIIIIISAIVHAALYRWLIDYTSSERELILLGIIAAPVGTYFTLIRADLKWSWSLVSLAAVGFDKMHARVLLLFGSVISELSIPRIAWGFYYFGVIVVMLIAMAWLFVSIQRASREAIYKLTLAPKKIRLITATNNSILRNN